MIGVLFIVALAAAALAYIVRPIVDGPRTDPDDISQRIEEASERKDAALMAILDITEEHEVGKLSDEDLDALRTQYEGRALAALREMDQIAAEEEGTDTLEAEIARMRQEITCPNCGAIRTTTTCSRCGASS